jgi:aminopeptidase N
MMHSSSVARQTLLALAFAIFTTGVVAQEKSYPTARFHYEPQHGAAEHPVDMEHMRVEVSFLPERGIVQGRVTHFFTPLRERVDTIFFHGPGIRITEATLNGEPAAFQRSPLGITVRCDPPLRWDERDSITFVYEATPQKGIFFVGWNDSTGKSRRQIWTQGQGINNRHWIPCYDLQNDKLTTETIITFDREYQVLSNGTKLAERDNGDGTKTWHYRMRHPHTTYLVMIGLGHYDQTDQKTVAGVPVHNWYYPEYPERVEPTYRYTLEALDFLAEHTGIPYPWESYAQIPVQDFLHGGMENTTATVFTDAYLIDERSYLDRNYVNTNVHEAAHQWFGDYVTARSGPHVWLQEGFATFYTKIFLRTAMGEEAYEWKRRYEHDSALKASLVDRLPIVHTAAGGVRIYSKASSVLDMMMYTFGEEAYRRVIKHYLQKHAYGNVETNDLYQAYQDVLGITPQKFFEQWLYRGGEPHYQVEYRDLTDSQTGARQTALTVRQVHARDDLVGLFSMPVVIEVHYQDGTSDARRVWIEGATENLTIPNAEGKEIAFLLFDPGSQILKSLTFDRTFPELRAQAERAPRMIDRYDAVKAMRPLSASTKRDVLVRLFDRESFHAIKTEILSQLVNDPDPASRKLVEAAIDDPEAQVRLTAIDSIRTIPAALREKYQELLQDSSYNVVASALQKLAVQFPQNLDRYLATTEGDRGVGNQVGILRYELMARRGDQAARDSLVEFSGPSYGFRSRVNALQALQRLNYLDRRVAGNLLEAATYWNNRLRAPARVVLDYFLGQHSHRKTLEEVVASRSWEPHQEKILQGLRF